MKGSFFLAVILVVLVVSANAQIRIVPEESNALFKQNELIFNLVFENLAEKSNEELLIEVVDPSNQIVARSNVSRKFDRGRTAASFRIFYSRDTDVDSLLWNRLKISFSGTREPQYLSFSEMFPDLFEMHVSTIDYAIGGGKFPVRIFAVHSKTKKPIAGVEIESTLNIDTESEEELILKGTGVTDRDGFAVIDFFIPESLKLSRNDSAEIEITGRKEAFTDTISEDISTISPGAAIYLFADKPLYQPNQTIYVRAMLLDFDRLNKKKAAAGRDIQFTIKDENGLILFRQAAQTSRFGIASIEWQIPANAKVGTYRAKVGESDGSGDSTLFFRVSRYELPNFIVQTEPDKTFYLPEDNVAKVTVDAVYLFGKPVAEGNVRVVRETERSWNYTEQKWETEEEESFEGKTDGEGKYVAEIDLATSHKELAEDEDEKFTDLRFTAYFTDETTNRTEERRFDLRISKEPIHVYVVRSENDYQHPKVPVSFYVKTFSADGDPLECDVSVEGKYDDETDLKLIATSRSNRFGAAKFEFAVPPRQDDVYYDDLELKITARHLSGSIGTETLEFDVDEDEPQIHVLTDKTIYKKGDPLKISIAASDPTATVFVDVMKGYESVHSERVKLKNGRADISIKYKPVFDDQIKVVAYFEDEDGDAVSQARGLIYPIKRNIDLKLETEKAVYRPNDEANLKFKVSSRNPGKDESAIGLVVIDKAVEERALIDSGSTGDIFAAFRGLLGKNRGFGGLTLSDIENLDLSKGVPADIQIAAEILAFEPHSYIQTFDSEFQKSLNTVFRQAIGKELEPVLESMKKNFNEKFTIPRDEITLREILRKDGIVFEALRDPWGEPFRVSFTTERTWDKVNIYSNGPNKIREDGWEYETSDDFLAESVSFEYFRETGLKIDRAVAAYVKETGKYVRNKEILAEILRSEGIDLSQLRDRWGEPYRVEFDVYGKTYRIHIRSGSYDQKFDDDYNDFTIWTTETNYFEISQNRISAILDEYVGTEKTFPQSENEFRALLLKKGLDFDSLRDGWGQKFYVEIEVSERFADRVEIISYSEPGSAPRERLEITPVTRKSALIRIKSPGADGEKSEYSYQDVFVAAFAGIISEQERGEKVPKVLVPRTVLTNEAGAIYGFVQDMNGAVIPGATVEITSEQSGLIGTRATSEDGTFVITSLVPGLYKITIRAPGFKAHVMNRIKVQANSVTSANFTMEAGEVNSVVQVVSSENVMIDTTDTKIDTMITRQLLETLPSGTSFGSLLKIAPGVISESLSGGFQIEGASGSEQVFIVDSQEVEKIKNGQINPENALPQRNSTPRLREYFPETLIFAPEILTDKNGIATLKLRLADNLTTWKIYAVASNLEGEIGIAEKEIKSFQPFFVDLDPPKNLTVGDEIFLPVQVRNYTEKAENVKVSMDKAPWFSLLGKNDGGTSVKQLNVDSDSTKNAVFGFRAETPVDEGRQRVTAFAENDSDAIEKIVNVSPDGREVVKTQSAIVYRNASLPVDIPANAIPGTASAEIKIFPNLFSHVSESVVGLLQRPYGCGEQTVSSTYPNLMILKFLGKRSEADSSKVIASQARRNLQRGYDRLLGYQSPEGGFTYWGGKDRADTALTAYAIKFLLDAREFIDVDSGVIENAQVWLLQQQKEDGGFSSNYFVSSSEDKVRDRVLTAYLARNLALQIRGSGETDDVKTSREGIRSALERALIFLRSNEQLVDDPYVAALNGLALIESGKKDEAARIAETLRKWAKPEGDGVYWNLETNTPFFGWGTAGRIETTALAVQFLAKFNDPASREAVQKGIVFLLKNKDRYGVWYSTQTTINVLDAFVQNLETSNLTQRSSVQISLNGEMLKTLEFEPGQVSPIVLNLSGKLRSGKNTIDIAASDSGSIMSQVVSNYYVNWNDETAKAPEMEGKIELTVNCDRTNAAVMDEINCKANAERIGFRGYGMLLAEIGTPPGADVSRESLDKALETDSSLSRYEVMPDRIVFYMWAKGGGTEINFKFKPRYAINALTPASTAYDYYNPEASALVPPLRFSIK